MSKRVLLGKFGTSSGEYGLRVSKTGSDVINANGTAVATDNLIFDSLEEYIFLKKMYQRSISFVPSSLFCSPSLLTSSLLISFSFSLQCYTFSQPHP